MNTERINTDRTDEHGTRNKEPMKVVKFHNWISLLLLTGKIQNIKL